VLHTLVRADGTIVLRTTSQGTSSLDDLPIDGIPDGTSRFSSTTNDVFLPNSGEVHKLTLNGAFVAAGTGSTHRFRVIVTIVVGADGTVQVDHLRFSCG
jgi:hypothetical protein